MQGHTHPVSHSLLRRVGLAGVLVAALSGCGGGSTACHECVIVPLGSTDGPSFDVGPGGAAGLGVVGGMGFVVQTSASNPIPVAGATVSLWSGGTFGPAVMYTDVTQTTPAGGSDFLELKTDDHGNVRVYPSATVGGCGSVTTDQTGSWSVTAATSNDQTSVVSTVNLKCAP
ncbi:MAG: hypothetical protein HZA24_10080 [Nitrospirae bacterium]|nr:hypothetical protein [Nitrospirota bacterium]